MKKSLLTHPHSLLVKVVRYSILIALCFMAVSQSLKAQAVFTFDECNCQSYPTIEGEGRFSETISFTGTPGGTYLLTNAFNFYDVASPADPAQPVAYPDSFMIVDMGGGNFEIDGIRIEGRQWEVTITEVIGGSSFLDYDLMADFNCTYPDTTIFGDISNCINTNDFYYVDLDDDEIASIQWSLSGGGQILSPTDENNIEIAWGGTTGTYQLTVDVVGVNEGDPSATQCMFSTTLDVDIVDEPQVQMSCDNNLNLSINGFCEMMITPEMVMPTMAFPASSYDILIIDPDADTIVPNNMISGDYIGKILKVESIHECGGNSCWGYIRVEDKAAPPLVCPPDTIVDCSETIDPETLGLPIPFTAIATKINENTFEVENFDLCGIATLTYEDELIEGLCVGPFSSIITRTWYVSDESGNTGSCSFNISINRSAFEDIVFPPSFDDEFGEEPSLQACSFTDTLANGAPSTNITGTVQGVLCLNASVSFEDRFVPKCSPENIENTHKIFRTWRVVSHCESGRDSTYTQFITVKDTIDPIVTVPAEYQVSTDAHSCAAAVELPAPMVDECSVWDYTIYYRLKDENGVPSSNISYENIVRHSNGNYFITDIPGESGEIWVTYVVSDACGNVGTAQMEVQIIDEVEPFAICDQFTNITLDEDGFVRAGFLSFDDKSYDNCGIKTFEIRRMENSACGEISTWGPKIPLCCEDVGETVMVILRVTDFSGNSNSCMVEARVEDITPPEFTSFPRDREVDCEDDLTDLSRFGFPTATDNCEVTIMEMPTEFLNECNIGEIRRRFIAKDKMGNEAVRTQIIKVNNDNFLNQNTIDFPDDLTLDDGCINSTRPEDLPVGFDVPRFAHNSCTNATYTYEDENFIYVEGACLKIIREWTVIDWCQFDGFYEEGYTFSDLQVIKINNSIKPTIVSGCSGQPQYENLDDCLSRVDLVLGATDDCTPSSELEYEYRLDIGNDGTINRSGFTNDASTLLPYGDHRIFWYVTDECGNTETCDYVFNIKDTKAPTPVCFVDIVTVIMENTGSVEIWASDFNKGSYDNCGDFIDLEYSFSSNTSNKGMVYTCEMLDGKDRDTFEVRMYVTDPDGNQAYCTTTVVIQDNQGYCNEEETIAANISGGVYLPDENMADEISLTLTSDLPEFGQQKLESTDGFYAFEDLEMYQKYAITGEKNGTALEGVTTLDLVLIQRYILGLKSFDSPYQVIAADINNDEKLSAADIIQLRKVILGIYPDFPENKSWRIIEKDQYFDGVDNPFPFAEAINFNNLDKDIHAADFIAIKVGDVDQSITNRSHTIQTRSFEVVKYSKTYRDHLEEYDFYLDHAAPLAGFQISLTYDASKMRFRGILGDLINISDHHINVVESNLEGQLTISWSTDAADKISGRMFSIQFEPLTKDYRNAFYVNKENVQPEIYHIESGKVATYEMVIEADLEREAHTIELLQNQPNPFNQETTIGFNLARKDEVNLSIFNISGKKLYEVEKTLSEGYHEIIVSIDDIGAGGMLYYQLSSGNVTITKRMLAIR